MVDYHIHLENGPYNLEWLLKFWQAAEKIGIRELGITEHCHKFKEFYSLFAYLESDNEEHPYMQEWIKADFNHYLEDYINLLTEAKGKGIPIKIGLEMDYLPNSAPLVEDIINQYPFDFILGSVHIIDKWGFDYAPYAWNGKNIDDAYIDYYQTLLEAVESNLFDVIAHLDLIKVFGHRNKVSVEPAVDQVLWRMREKGLCMEISSAGIRKPVNEIYPADWIIQKAARLQIPITFASDAHYPKDVGFRWRDLVGYAIKYGYTNYTTFSCRHPNTLSLPAL